MATQKESTITGTSTDSTSNNNSTTPKKDARSKRKKSKKSSHLNDSTTSTSSSSRFSMNPFLKRSSSSAAHNNHNNTYTSIGSSGNSTGNQKPKSTSVDSDTTEYSTRHTISTMDSITTHAATVTMNSTNMSTTNTATCTKDSHNSNLNLNVHGEEEDHDCLISLLTQNTTIYDDKEEEGPTTDIRNTKSLLTTANKEKRLKKILSRVTSALLMLLIFIAILYSGHIYVCALIFILEVLIFRELVRVRYNSFFHVIEEKIPLFRTTQWMWFNVAIFYTYSDFVLEVIKSNTSLHHLLKLAKFQPGLAFALYSGTFVLTIATMQRDHIKFQINQLCWTILVLCLTVGQLKYIMHNVYNGLFWFALPIFLVISNDTFAWAAGVTCGRKFINRDFIPLSPNKTWEGFIGGWIGTMFAGWYLSRIMAQYTWMTCPTNQFRLLPDVLECDLDPIFHQATNIVPSQIFEMFPSALVKSFNNIVDICMVDGDANILTACVSGEESHTHHHFELKMKNFYPVQVHALGLSLFASVFGPFGGFLASGIKRAYGIKDFDSIIPGHGGLMDRMDCQFLMALYTWVHYNTFVKMATVSVPKMIYMYHLLKESEQAEFLEKILHSSQQ